MKPEKHCPECKGPINWKVVRNTFGSPVVNGLCTKCNIIFRRREAPHVTEGKNLERDGTLNGTPVSEIDCMDRRITSLPIDVQIGILRERQKNLGKGSSQ
jgi:hypothetical protein